MNKAVLAASMRAAINQAQRLLQRLDRECAAQKISARSLVTEITRQHTLLYAMTREIDTPPSPELAEDDDKDFSGLLSEE